MWFVYASVLFGFIAFALRKYGLNFYHRFGRPVFIRRIVGKTRPSTPPLDNRRHSKEHSDHSVFQVYDDGTIVSSKIEKPPMVIRFIKSETRSTFVRVDRSSNSSILTLKWVNINISIRMSIIHAAAIVWIILKASLKYITSITWWQLIHRFSFILIDFARLAVHVCRAPITDFGIWYHCIGGNFAIFKIEMCKMCRNGSFQVTQRILFCYRFDWIL